MTGFLGLFEIISRERIFRPEIILPASFRKHSTHRQPQHHI